MDYVTVEELFELVLNTKIDSSSIIAQLNLRDATSLRNTRNQTLLHVAAGYGRTNLASYLIRRGADVDAQDNEGQAPLHSACCHGHSTTARKLIQAGALVDIVDIRGWTPLHWALARKDNAEGISPIYWKVIKLLLDSGADPHWKSISGHSCLNRIKNSEDKREVQILHVMNLIERCGEETELREQIIDKYLSIEDYFELVKIGDEKFNILELLTTSKLISSRLTSCENITPLHRAAGYNHLALARLFIQKGARVNSTDGLGRIPLHNAAQYGHEEMIELLVEENSDINKQDLRGKSPLHVAASNRTFTACLKLIELGANVNLKCHDGKLPYDLAESNDVYEVLKPDSLRYRSQVIPSTSDHGVYIARIPASGFQQQQEQVRYSSLTDVLMFDSSSDRRLHSNTSPFQALKEETLKEDDSRYQKVKKRMLDTIMKHNSESSGFYSSYEILNIKLLKHEKVWTKYKLMCQRLEIEYGPGSKNEKLLFHGSNFVEEIERKGFDERYAQRDGMFGAGIYFAKHSSKSNQYTFGFGKGCQEHKDKCCYICERKMIYAQVALGRSLTSKEAMPNCAHAPPGFSSVTGSPESTDNLIYPEYVIYNGDQAYPLFVITYRIKP